MRKLLVASVAAFVLTAAGAAAVTLQVVPPADERAQGEPASRAVPGITWTSGSAVLRLTDTPCPSPEMSAELGMEGVTPPRVYVVEQGAKKTSGCWSTDVGGDVVTMEPGREIGTIPLDWFRARGA
jgi:hypothetical protein